jgi:amino acid adenylation domain-containing protein/non-ribosomal peptide synthase protein (TIGR01720 family)
VTSVDTAPAIELPADRAAITVYLAEAYSEITQRPAPDPAAVLTLDSLQAVQLVGRVELDLGIDAPVDNMFGEFTLEELADQVAATLQGDRRTPATVLQVDVANRHEPFPLTAIQQAYLLGRAGLFDLGDVSTHLYMEFEHTDLDLDRLTVALRRLIDRQDMLRAVVSDDGQQRILADVSPYEIVTTDLRGRTEQEAARQLLETRERMSHQVIPADRWPLFEVRAQRVDDHRTRLHLSVDLLIADAASIALLLGEWSRLYRSPDAVVDPLEMSFRDYVLALEERRNGEQYAAARDYWISRIPELPAAPELPYDPRSTDNRFVRRWRAIDADTWAALQRRAADAGLTPSTLLCAAYADVLAAWAKDPCFTINVTLGERLPLHPQVRDLIGDFTAVTLLAVDCSWSRDFTDRAGRLQSQLRQDMEYRVFSGVEMLREMARRSDAAPRMPVVFTSMVGVGFDGSAQLFDTPTFAVSQTPQVLLDNQVLERNGRLEISWDAVDARFQPGVLDAMFDAYGELLERLAAGDPPASPGALVPASDRLLWTTANDTAQEPVDGLLHEPIARWAGETPDAPAIITTERTLSYAELDRAANQIAHRLRRLSARPNELVGVVMEKGWEQVAAVLGVLRAGAAYLPIDAALPAARIGHLLDRGEVRVALTQSWVDDHTDWPTGVERLRVDEPAGEDDTPIDCPAKPGDLAYVIFTSGSTGEPKGVMIEHRAALNTVVDVNSRFEVGPTDRTLALSSLSFDLSVYDVFGTLAAGGTIVIPDGDAGRDPVRWADLVQTHGVTIWNSVPALLGLLADAADGNRNAVGTSLRLALLSGDWIPMELPGRFRTLAPHAELVSLGGATEGSIWSIIYPITDIDPRWTSVPYGRAMVNQTMHVLGVDHEPRPVWVPGEIHIGGAGVATGYWRDEAKTTERFVRDPHTGERRYRTGDLGRLLPDGNIEFLGREDFQVKIRGYRVELGEIEAVLAEHAGVRTVVVTAASDSNGAKRLVAHYVPVPESAISDADLRDHASNRLPEYMVPSVFVASEALPLTSNGKVDRGRLVAPPEACPARHAGQTARGGRTDVEQTLARVWREVLNTADVQHDDEFLGSGGDSLLALRLVARLGAAGITIRARDILAGATFGDLCERAGVVDSDEPVATVPPVTGDVPLTPNQLWFLDQDFTDAHHWNGMWPLIMVTEQLDPVLLGAAVHRLFVHHDALRTRFHRTPDGWRATIEEPAAALPVPFSVVDLTNVPDDAVSDAVDQTCERLQASLDLETGPVIRITYLDLGPDRMPRLHVAAHWATVDYYSSRVLVEDLLTAYAQLQAGQDIRLPAKTMSVIEACNALHAEAQTDDIGDEVDYWLAPERRSAAEIPFDHATGPNVQGSARRVLVTLGQAETTRLVTELPRQYGCEVREVILTALGRAFASWTGRDSLVLDIEGHGREDVVHGDISRTVGRFSTLWPLLLHTPAGPPAEALAAVAPQVRRPRDRGVWHGLLRYVREDPELRQQLADIPPAQVGFNYWGRVDEYFNELVRPSTESPGPHRGARGMRPRPIDVLGFVAGGELALVWSYSHNLHLPETVGRLAEQTMTELRSLLGFETEPGSEHGRPRALHVDEHRPMQFDDVWSLAGLAGMTDSTEEEAR